jgi:hypothetical protein
MKKALMLSFFALIGAMTMSFANVNPDPCPCEGGYVEMQLYYFGPDNVTIQAYSDSDLNPADLITTFPNVSSGDLIVVSGAGLPEGRLGVRTYFTYTVGEEVCTTAIYSRCPTNVYPNALEELKILGKTFGHFTVYAHTDEGNNIECTLDNADQDWHVGGNVVGPGKKTLGTRNNEDVIIISNDTPRGIITRTGDLGWGTQTPSTDFDLQGNALINETLTVNGQTSINDVTPSTDASNGALTVAGGTGIAGNANVGENLDVDGTATIGNDLTVEAAGVTRLQNTTQSASPLNGALIVSGGAGVAMDVNIGEDLDVDGEATIGNDLTVEAAGVTRLQNTTQSTSPLNGALSVSGGAGVAMDVNIGEDLDVDGEATIGNDLTVEAAGVTRLQNMSPSTSPSDGALSVSGGVGVGMNLNVGNDGYIFGLVGIGTNNVPAGYQLAVDGAVICEEVLVQLSGDWPDYVFESDYELQTLKEVEQFIAQHGHLPNVPSAKELENSGLSLSKITTIQQEKIEEIYLHLIELKNEVSDLKTENAKLKAKIDELK